MARATRVLVPPRYPGDAKASPLHAAAYEADEGALAALLVDAAFRSGPGAVPEAELEAVDFQGFTPLMRAACNGGVACAAALIAAGADPTHVASSGRTALHHATECPLAESVGHDSGSPEVAGVVLGGNPARVTPLLQAKDQWAWSAAELARHFNRARTHALLTTAATDPKTHLEKYRSKVTRLKQQHEEKVAEQFGKVDKAMAVRTPICVAGYGRGSYVKLVSKFVGGNEHMIEMASGCFASEERDGWVAGDVLPIKLKSEVWTVYASDFERVEQLKSMNVKSSKKKKKPKKQGAAQQKGGLQDWHVGDAVRSEVLKLESKPKLSIVQASHIRHLASQARTAAEEQLHKSLEEGFTPEQVRAMIERQGLGDDDNISAAAASMSPMDAMRKSRERMQALEAEAERVIAGGGGADSLEVLAGLAPDGMLQQVEAPAGTLGVRVIAVVCSAERGSAGWLNFMERLLHTKGTSQQGKTGEQSGGDGAGGEQDAEATAAGAQQPLPVCHMSLLMSAGHDSAAAAAAAGIIADGTADNDSKPAVTLTNLTPRSQRVTFRCAESGVLCKPEDDSETNSITINRSDVPDLTPRSSLMLCWPTEEKFELRPSVFTSSDRRVVRVDIEDVGAADIDLSSSPDTGRKWRLRQWVELADEQGRHAASAQVQVRWSPAGRPLSPERPRRGGGGGGGGGGGRGGGGGAGEGGAGGAGLEAALVEQQDRQQEHQQQELPMEQQQQEEEVYAQQQEQQ
jgi:hypothetical protein